MKALATLCLLLFIAIPLFAVFQLLHRLETHKVDEGASRRFYEALREEYGLVTKPKRALTEDERIALARKISEDPFGDITACDVMEDDPETPSERKVVSLAKTGEDGAAEAEENEEEKKKRLSREKALATVNAMLDRPGKNKKGDALAELQRTLEKYRKQQ
ncbi:MAG: hypothetical protein IJL67_10940 [Oscillospiraceae bacterium]|nr:hypothetical protein [Oscillospiraceae bacterium]MBQ5989997.1 hypothetical protein [Oscillospiraceae bacterium]MBR3026122.1 hypothetical protein [Oscillospiraceae bacterium]MBR3537155.1 hypothetical protein [Oscillospiraceae bacterium]